MKSLTVGRYSPVLEKNIKTNHYVDIASQKYFKPLLACIWCVVCVLALLAVTMLDYIWLVGVAIVAGVFLTFCLMRSAKIRTLDKAPVQNLSHASKCVWQMDREA
jgi:Flp pilus assembly protein TadB